MTDFLARNWVFILALGGMAFMHFGMHRGQGKAGGGGGCCGGQKNEGHEPAASTRHDPETGRPQGSQLVGAVGSQPGSPQDTPAPSNSSVQVEDAHQEQRGGCC
ncbi:MAG: hypothetical protein ABI438_02285 [Dermatophilaceae bacterium]